MRPVGSRCQCAVGNRAYRGRMETHLVDGRWQRAVERVRG